MIDVIYSILALVGSVCAVHCIMWTWETDLSFSEMRWYQKGKVIAAKVTMCGVAAFWIYVFTAFIWLLLR